MPLPGQSPADRRAQTVTVTVGFTLTCIILCLLTRLYMRWPWSKEAFWRNDILAIGATLFAVGEAAAVAVAVHNGLGHPTESLDRSDAATIQRCLLTAKLLFYLSVGLASMSVVEFIVKLKGPKKVWLVDYALRLVTPVWGIAGVISSVVLLGLKVQHVPPALPTVFAIVGALIQITTFTAAFIILRDLKSTFSTKTRVLLGFSPSFLVVAGFIGSIPVLYRHMPTPDTSTRDKDYIIVLQCILLASFIYATTPSLLQIGRAFQTGYSGPLIDERNTMAGTMTSSFRNKARAYENDSFNLRQMGPQNIVSSVSAHERDRSGRHTEKPRRSLSRKRLHKEGDGISVSSDSSQKIIICKTVTQSSVNVHDALSLPQA